MRQLPTVITRARIVAALRSHAWRAFAALGAALVVAYFLLPTAADQDVFYQLPEMLAVSAILFGIRLHRPRDARPWYLLAAGVALTATGDWTWVILDRIYGLDPFPSLADVFYLGGMATIGAAIWTMLRGRLPGGDRAGVLDALIVTVSAGLLTWVFLMAPIVSESGQSPAELGVALAYPLIDILLLGGLVRLVLAPGEMPPSLRLIIGALVAFLLADYQYALLALNDAYEVGSVVDAGWIIGAVLWGTAGLHPSMRTVARPVEERESRLSPWRVVLLAGASLMAPALLLLQWLGGWAVDVSVVAAGCIVLFLLVIARLQGVVHDLRTTLDERTALEQELQRRALHDPLTGLPNRVLFHDRLTHALSRRQGSVAVMLLDLDDFKTVNDSHGHAMGDRVLRSVASSLTDVLRAEDTVARLGGDEFAVLLTDSPDRYAASLVAGRLLEAVQVQTDLAGYRRSIAASIGISLGVAGEADAEDLIRDADIAMYVAKGQGKGTFTVFEPSEHHEVVRGLELRNDLENALEQRQFELDYQPIMDLVSGEVAGVEALVRWRHPTLGRLMPAEFIPLTESTGAIIPLGRWILREACRTAASWETPFLSVNLSGHQLADESFPDDLRYALLSSGLPANRLVLELTESAQLAGEQVAATLATVRDMGVRLAIDHFGTGHAPLLHLSRTQVDLVKIDRSFVAGLGQDPRREALVSGVLQLARQVEVSVVAEGIEDGVQLARLRQAGCPMGQGYLFATPMSRAELRSFLASQQTAAAPRRVPRSTPEPGPA